MFHQIIFIRIAYLPCFSVNNNKSVLCPVPPTLTGFVQYHIPINIRINTIIEAVNYSIPCIFQSRPVILRITTHILCLHVAIIRIFFMYSRQSPHACPLHANTFYIFIRIFLLEKSAYIIRIRIIDCSHPDFSINGIFFKLGPKILIDKNSQVFRTPSTGRPAGSPCDFILRHNHLNVYAVLLVSLYVFGKINGIRLKIPLLHFKTGNIPYKIAMRVETVVPHFSPFNTGTLLRIMFIDFHPCRRCPRRGPHLQIRTQLQRFLNIRNEDIAITVNTKVTHGIVIFYVIVGIISHSIITGTNRSTS